MLVWDKDCGLFIMVEDCGEFTVLTTVNCNVVDHSPIAHFFAHLKDMLFMIIKTKAYFRHKS